MTAVDASQNNQGVIPFEDEKNEEIDWETQKNDIWNQLKVEELEMQVNRRARDTDVYWDIVDTGETWEEYSGDQDWVFVEN